MTAFADWERMKRRTRVLRTRRGVPLHPRGQCRHRRLRRRKFTRSSRADPTV